MDLCLIGSQINLATRPQQKPKFSSQNNLQNLGTTTGAATAANTRPRSANFLQNRSRTSPFFYRPQSADPKFGGLQQHQHHPHYYHNANSNSHLSSTAALNNCGHFCNEFKNSYQKQRESLSSSNLLKLLLDEPIKRSWLCSASAQAGGAGVGGGGGGGSTTDDSETFDVTRKTTSQPNLYKTNQAEKLHKNNKKCKRNNNNNNNNIYSNNNSAESEQFVKLTSFSFKGLKKANISSSLTKMSSTSSSLSSNLTVNTAKHVSAADDYWSRVPYTTATAAATTTTTNNASTNFTVKVTKPDLPGRVSFSKPHNMYNDMDFSDCDNDKSEQQFNDLPNHIDLDISAPGPMNITAQFNAQTSKATDSNADFTYNGYKKSVHFNAAGGEDILAETYEYPKCPSENCSCSTRSSSTASIQEGIETTQRCTFNGLSGAYFPEHEIKTTLAQAVKALEDSPVIRDYKTVIGSEQRLENISMKIENKLNENKPAVSSFCNLNNNNNNMEFATYVEKYVQQTKSELHEKQNNLSETKNNAKTTNKQNLIDTNNSSGNTPTMQKTNELLKSCNNLHEEHLHCKTAYTSSSESVINNYLKVTAKPPCVTKKKENNKLRTNDAATQNGISNGKRNKTATQKTLHNNNNDNTTTSRVKSAGNGDGKLKKMVVGSFDDDTNLKEFHLDKVDSWMSLHEQAMAEKNNVINNNYEKLTKETLNVMLEVEKNCSDSNSQDSTNGEDGDDVEDADEQEDSTYDEIVSVIKEIEEDKKKDNFAEATPRDLNLKLDILTETTTTTTTTTPIPTPEINAVQNEERVNSPDKFKDILSYLDDVEDSCDKTLLETRRSIPDSNRSEIEFVVEPDIAEDVPKLSDLLMLPNHQLARRVIALSLRANELANALLLSKEHVFKMRTERQKSMRNEKANTATRLREQKKHFEGIVQRHQNFIEQLLKDKGSLCEKVAALTRRLESQNQAWEHKLTTEIARVKDTSLASEKIRRERWVRENTKKIKELTVKGLEAEINKMTCEHQSEITELKRIHQQQILDALEEARIKHEQIETNIREACAQDRETIIEKERIAIRERFERQLEDEHKSFDEQRQKFCEELAAERSRCQKELKAKEHEYQLRRQEMQHEKDNDVEQLTFELHEKMSKQEEKYQNRINSIEKQYVTDFELWKKEYENKCKIELVEKENTVRQHYRAERDRQIDEIVSRMDAEALKNAEEYDIKLNRLKEKYEKDLQDAENVEKSLRAKYTELRNNLAESDAQVRNHQAEVKQLQIELGHSKKMCNDYLNERDQIRENLRNEIQAEITNIKNERDNEIQKIHKRVQQAIEKKDATVDILQKENGSLRERCLKLEAIIRQQRKDYCVK